MERIAIIGTGLIGGSIGLALKAARLNDLEIIGFDIDRGTAGEAKRRGAVDRNAPSLAEAVRGAKMVVIATPPLSVGNVMQEISEHLTEGAVITDTASTKIEVRRYAQEFLPEALVSELRSSSDIGWVKTLSPVLPVLSRREITVPFTSCAEMLRYGDDRQLDLWELAIHYESARGNLAHQVVFQMMQDIVGIMRQSIRDGVAGTVFAASAGAESTACGPPNGSLA